MRSIFALVVAAAGLAAPAVANASDATTDETTTVITSGYEPADLVVNHTAVVSMITDNHGGGVFAGPGCFEGTPVVCPGPFLQVDLNGGNDRLVSTGFSRQTVSGGNGADVIWASGASGKTSGGAGNDHIRVNANETSDAHGDGGNDVIWGHENTPTLSGDDGSDFVFADGMFNAASGGAGNDQLVGNGGFHQYGTMDGGAGDDVIAFLAGDDTAGTWTIDGGDGADTIVGSLREDTINGGKGADRIDVTGDGQADVVDCGAGVDTVYYDRDVDRIAANCENRYKRPMPASWSVQCALARAAAIRDEFNPLLFDPRG